MKEAFSVPVPGHTHPKAVILNEENGNTSALCPEMTGDRPLRWTTRGAPSGSTNSRAKWEQLCPVQLRKK